MVVVGMQMAKPNFAFLLMDDFFSRGEDDGGENDGGENDGGEDDGGEDDGVDDGVDDGGDCKELEAIWSWSSLREQPVFSVIAVGHSTCS